jgi:hypothetical protein
MEMPRKRWPERMQRPWFDPIPAQPSSRYPHGVAQQILHIAGDRTDSLKTRMGKEMGTERQSWSRKHHAAAAAPNPGGRLRFFSGS